MSATENSSSPAELPAPEKAPEKPEKQGVQGLAARLGFVTRDGARIGQVEAAVTLLIVLLGLYMRFSSVVFGEPIGFWNDEANWAVRLVKQPLKDLLIRPIGFMLLTRWSVAVFGQWEYAVRLLPWLAGLATPLIAVLLGRRFLSRPAARLVFIGILSLSPMAIDYSKEFKPYGVSLMLHLLLPLLVLRWNQTRRTGDLVVAGTAAALAVFFAQDVIFLYPGLFLVLAVECTRSRNFRQLGVAAGFAVLSAGIVLGMYVLIWSRLPKDQSDYWGNKYGVFYRPKAPTDTALGWYAGKYKDILEVPGTRRNLLSRKLIPEPLIQPVVRVDRLAWLALHIGGLAVMILRRRYREALLFLSPTLVCAVFNYLGYWPFGTFRTNVFLLAGMSAVAALGLDWKGATKRAWAVLVPVALLVFTPLLLSDNEWGFTKQAVSSSPMPEMLNRLLVLPETQNIKKEPLYLDSSCFNVVRYYLNHYARASEWKAVKAKFKLHYGRRDTDVYKAARKLAPDQRGWMMLNRKGTPPARFRPRLLLDLNGYQFYMVQGPPRK